MIAKNSRDISDRFNDDELMDQALRDAVNDALLDHKRAGNPICVWRDGKVVWIQPQDIPVSD